MLYANKLFFTIKLFCQILFLCKFINAESTDYAIFTNHTLREAADSIAALYSSHVNDDLNLITSITTIETNIEAFEIRAMIQEQIQQNTELSYLLLLGDESILPPIYKNGIPSDDFYSTEDEISGIPILSTGRIPVNNLSDALLIASKIKNYSKFLEPGLWRNKVALIADDQYKNGSYAARELNHTKNSDELLRKVKNKLIPLTFYGTLYESENSANGLSHPNLSSDIIQTINNGIGLINYIGHGSSSTFSDEKIIDMNRDISRICPPSSKCYKKNLLPIWVAGTCSFGQYDEFDTMVEALLKHEAGAISIISTSRSIGENSNFDFLERFFDEISNYIDGDNMNYRLGDIFKNSKYNTNSDYLFHLFGDPALPIPFAVKTNNIINENSLPSEFTILKEEQISLDVSTESNVTINSMYQESKFFFEEDSIQLLLPTNTIYQGSLIYDNFCFRIPLDAVSCDTCFVDMILNSKSESGKNQIQFITNISLIPNESNIEDMDGPDIVIYYLNNIVSEGMVLQSGSNLKVELSDPLGLNLMSGFQHSIRYWYNNDDFSYYIDPQLLEYDASCNRSSVNIFLPEQLSFGDNSLFIEAWDSANNRSLKRVDFRLDETSDFKVFQVYAIPNPFKETTNFTFWLESNEPTNISINVISPNGEKISSIKKICLPGFNSIPWNGSSSSNEDIANGPYVYHLKAISGSLEFEDYFKIFKLK